MRVMVLGSTGLLGSSLVPYLQNCGHEVLTNIPRVDLTELTDVLHLLNQAKPQVIVNLAALTNVDECEQKPQQAYLLNVHIVENITQWIKLNHQNCHLVHISTDQVYDGPGPHDESQVTLSNYYAFSKYAGELVAAHVPATILRTNFFGPGKCHGRMSFSDWLMQALIQQSAITVFEDVRFAPLSLQRLIALIELVVRKRHCGTFNLGSKEGLSKADFAFMLATVMKQSTSQIKRGLSIQSKLAAYRPQDMCMDCSKFEALFAITLPTLEEEIFLLNEANTYEIRY